MEILILIAVIATGASALYMAYTFKNHIEKNVAPLLERVTQDARNQIEAASKGLGQQIQATTGPLEAVASKDLVTNGELRQQVSTMTGGLKREIQTIADELQQDRELTSRLSDGIAARQDQIGEDLRRTDHRVAQLGESLARQGAQLTAIHGYVRSQGRQTGTSQEPDQLMLGMLAAESDVGGKGWGTPPHLYALTERPAPASAGDEHAAGTPDGLIPVPHELPDGDLAEALAAIRWPEDVAGCVLVAELTDLPAGVERDAPIDPVAAGQWTSTCREGRPARLAVGVRRNGEHACAFRAQGDDDIQIRTDMAVGSIVTALFRTF
ncbi:MAG: PPA1309 family protein [Streptosporangiaceae bacterium]